MDDGDEGEVRGGARVLGTSADESNSFYLELVLILVNLLNIHKYLIASSR